LICDISHRTTYSYAAPVSLSQHLLHLTPRATPNQVCHHHSLLVEPAPTVNSESRDFFGNATAFLTLEEPHDRLTILAVSRIAVSPPNTPPADATTPWDRIGEILAKQRVPETLEAHQFVFDSPFTYSDHVLEFARESFPPGRPILEGTVDLMSRIFREFKYEGGVTDINTPVDKVLRDRRGVCQDFAHLQIAALRSLGLPARYVSGYLRTHPPEGQERKIGADASHAWLAVWVPEHGWVDLDPTNDMIPRDEHITVAWGRDYGDVSPINGMMLGGGEHRIHVAVDVKPLE
jgi:transglutaminase-like putative cysteine protease